MHQYDAADNHIWLNNIHCNGTETHLAYCTTAGWGNRTCLTNKTIGLSCGMQGNGKLTLTLQLISPVLRYNVIVGCEHKYATKLDLDLRVYI